ncbi:MAG: ribosome biogenesis factor YjgA [Chromatiales bacterium]|jgi:ribosome-associated protein
MAMNPSDDFDDDTDIDDEADEIVSKSQLKRDMQAIVDLAGQLLDFPQEKIAACGISDKALQALQEARPMKASGAKKRQLKYVAKLLKNEDITALQRLVEQSKSVHLAEQRRFHELEKWRDRLIEQGDTAIEPLLEVMPDINRQQLRQLIRTAQKELQQQKAPAAARKLFKYLRENGKV